jgi:hypothetical protein
MKDKDKDDEQEDHSTGGMMEITAWLLLPALSFLAGILHW